MPGLRLRFPGGRYHATPWGHHVNEGQVEWPPSPWRILRALVSCGYTTQQWKGIPESAGRLFGKLAGTLPSYRLPEGSVGHSRHYMPLGKIEGGREKTTLVYDTWLHLGDGVAEAWWDCGLAEDETAALRALAQGLGYLGRSESWVVAEALSGPMPDGRGLNAFPHVEGVYPGPGWEQVTLMAPLGMAEYAKWRAETTGRLLERFPLPEGKKKVPAKLQRDRERVVEPYPEDLLACLTKDTAWWKGYQWSMPPGSQRVLYWRRDESMEVSVPQRPRVVRARPVTTALLAMTTVSGGTAALPGRERTLPQAELLHKALVGVLGQGEAVGCPELTGRDGEGRPLRDRHRHTHVLPVDLDGDGRLDHVLIHAPMGLGGEAQRAIRSLRRTWTKGGAGDLQLALAGSGGVEDFRRLSGNLGASLARVLGPRGGAKEWVSMTPFVAPRFVKARGKNTLEGQVREELKSRGLPEAVEVTVLDGSDRAFAFRHYARRRQRGGAPPPVDVGYAISLRFGEPVSGPLTLGYGAHFGLGLFEVKDDPGGAAKT